MTTIFWLFIAFWATMQVTYVFYLAIMDAMRARDTMPKVTWFFIGPALLVGVLMDFTLNMMMTIPFADLPREFLLTKRLHRYRDNPIYDGSRRRKAAKWICENLLNPFDATGKHC